MSISMWLLFNSQAMSPSWMVIFPHVSFFPWKTFYSARYFGIMLLEGRAESNRKCHHYGCPTTRITHCQASPTLWRLMRSRSTRWLALGQYGWSRESKISDTFHNRLASAEYGRINKLNSFSMFFWLISEGWACHVRISREDCVCCLLLLNSKCTWCSLLISFHVMLGTRLNFSSMDTKQMNEDGNHYANQTLLEATLAYDSSNYFPDSTAHSWLLTP